MTLLLQEYNNLLEDHTSYFILTSGSNFKDGKLDSSLIYSGSFNPFHEGHFAILQSLPTHLPVYLELSLSARNKEIVSFNQLTERINSIRRYTSLPIIITNQTYFKDKVNVLTDHQPHTFVIGFDTAYRLYKDDGVDNINKIPATFLVFERGDSNLDHIAKIPCNFLKARLQNNIHRYESSTRIRHSQFEVESSE